MKIDFYCSKLVKIWLRVGENFYQGSRGLKAWCNGGGGMRTRSQTRMTSLQVVGAGSAGARYQLPTAVARSREPTVSPHMHRRT